MTSDDRWISPPYSTKRPCALGAKCVLHDSCREFCVGLALHLDGIAVETHDDVVIMTRAMLC